MYLLPHYPEIDLNDNGRDDLQNFSCSHPTTTQVRSRVCLLLKVAFSSPTPVALVSTCRCHVVIEIEAVPDTSCILAWLIEQGYEVYAFLADVGQEEVRNG
jgi:hypothetical protein